MIGYNESAESLIEQYHSSADEALRERIVKMHLNVAEIVAKRFSGRGVDFDDLYQVACLALVKAIDRFNPQMGVRFSTYLTPTMVGEVKNYFRDRSRLISIPRSGTELIKSIKAATESLEQSLLRNPTLSEIAQHIGVPLETVLEAMEMQTSTMYASLDSSASEEEQSPLAAYLGKRDEAFDRFELGDMIKRALDRLPEDEKRVIIYRYIDSLSQREVAEKIGVSQMTVSRVERRAISKLQGIISPKEDS